MKAITTTTMRIEYQDDQGNPRVVLTKPEGGKVNIWINPRFDSCSVDEAREMWSALGRALDAVDGKVGS